MASYRSGRELKAFSEKPDLMNAVERFDAPGFVFRKGSHWTFWMEDDPREDDGNNVIARFVCVEGGDDDSFWEKVA